MKVEVTSQGIVNQDKFSFIQDEVCHLRADDAIFSKIETIVKKNFDCKVYHHLISDTGVTVCKIHLIGNSSQ